METRRWTNPSQPQTLYMAHLFLYVSAAFNLLWGLINGFTWVLPLGASPSLALVVCEVVGGYFIANERKAGWWLGLAAVALSLYAPARALMYAGASVIFNVNWILLVAFPLVLLILLVHPMSRDYQRIWFK
jgi:hypothetical protein